MEARYYEGSLHGSSLFGRQRSLQEFAARAGKEPSQLVEEAVDRMLEYEARLIEAVEAGRESARQGDLLEHDEGIATIERSSRS